jgi:hypothetical protein
LAGAQEGQPWPVPAVYGDMSHKVDPTNIIALQKPDGHEWRIYARMPAKRQKIDVVAVDFTIGWVDAIERGHRVSDRSGQRWTVLRIFRMNPEAEQPSLLLTCRRVPRKKRKEAASPDTWGWARPGS